ncbi:MAG: glutathione S-transferase N-terminal domain-containing protein [Pseudomonadales bacterium]|nr:glutathione S-transferase N-terminal domain-containing protein [Pseudomonadales bacterium]
MLKLLYTPIADYVHTVESVVQYVGVADQLELVPTRPYDTDTQLPTINPLGKVPVLILESGEYLAGGPVIYEYLDSLHRRRKLYPAKGPQRWRTLRQAWMADGLFDTLVLMIVEAWLPREQQRPDYLARCWGKVMHILDQIERDIPTYARLDIGQMRTMGALLFMRLKMAQLGAGGVGLDPGYDFTVARPVLAAWFELLARKRLFRQPLVTR